jgi:superfamily II DNA or RNA helicase
MNELSIAETPAKPTKTPRPYQVEAKRAIYSEFRVHRSTLLVLATGLGKTFVFTSIIADGLRKGKRILVLAHRDELIEQAVTTIEDVIGKGMVGIEKGKRHDASKPSTLLDGTGRVVVSSVQTMIRRLGKIPPDSFDLVIRDEAHHCVSPTDLAVLAHFAGAKVLGVTATPNRGDQKALREVFDSVAYDMNILDGIMEGWLVPVRQQSIKPKGLDLSMVRRSHGDFDRTQLAEVMESLDMLRAISVPTVQLLSGRQALVFCVGVRHAELQAESIREVMRELKVEGEVVSLDGKTPKEVRDDVVARFRAGEIRVLVNCELLTEGFDAPTCSLIVMARPTQSKALYLQILGRGTRPLPGVVDPYADEPAAVRRAAIAASSKPDMLVLDLVGNTGKHDMIHAADMLGGDDVDPDIKEAERILARGETDDLMRAIEMARAARFGRERLRLAKDGDLFALFGLVRETDRWRRPMSDKQRSAMLRTLADPKKPAGDPLVGIDRRGANQAFTEIKRREVQRLCTYKQARALARWGVPLEVVEAFTFEGASKAMSNLAAANRSSSRWTAGDGAWWRDVAHRGGPKPDGISQAAVR